ncbi:MAG: mannose-1-phosphate guanylyltransferase [Candidatus Omnitrophota bacterium]|jgi:mannose-1-phosphate guanylyltransferase/mannose-6-phosphate isomerase
MPLNRNTYAVILAGGSGTRFWPLSRPQEPKQFLNILSEKTLFQKTVERVLPLIPADRIYIVTGVSYKKIVRRQIHPYKIPSGNVLLEPSGKNTAPAICWAAAALFKKNSGAILAVFPADHLILKPQAFCRHLKEAFTLAEQQYLVTMGIVPHRPETGYGYMKCRKQRQGKRALWTVEKFVEKPDLKKAQQYLKEKTYFWNSGIFIWRADNILTEYAVHLPDVYNMLFDKPSSSVLANWSRLPSVSVDYAILEKAENVVSIPSADMGWSDLGSWEALYDVLPKDKRGNHLSGNAIERDCRNVLIRAEGRPVAAIGLEDVVIVSTGDAILVCRRDNSQKVRAVADVFQQQKRGAH